jgi:hypothetical protein
VVCTDENACFPIQRAVYTDLLFATHVDEREAAIEKDFARVQAKVETELLVIDGLVATQKLQKKTVKVSASDNSVK